MQLQNLYIERIITHQIFQREQADKMIPPRLSHEYTRFDPPAMNKFKKRVNQALGRDSKAVQMEIIHQDPNDLITLIDQMADQDEETFKTSSFDVAVKLSKRQTRLNYPGGIVVIFMGTHGSSSKKFLGIIKAEVHSGYEKFENPKTKEISLKFVEELLLTPASRLYKTAGFLEKNEYDSSTKNLNDKWMVLVSDTQINRVNGKAAAQYFYEGFLGCGYRVTSARTTKQFYDAAVSFISGLDVTQVKKNELYNALTIYLKVDLSGTVSTSDFAERYFNINDQDSFSAHMNIAGVPKTAFIKDTEHIESKLKLRRIKFNSNVRITASPEAFRDLILVETIEGDPDESGISTEWTKVTIKDKIANQE